MAAAEATSPSAVPLMTRREFLYYIWAGSMALFGAQTTVALLWFAYPRFKAGTFGGIFELDISEVPPADSGPKAYSGGRFWLVNLGEKRMNDEREGPQNASAVGKQAAGVKALYMICVHLGCLYQWKPTNDRFECPCHGSKYLASGHRVEGPAGRNLDVFIVETLDAEGKVLARTEARDGNLEGSALSLDGVKTLRVNTGRRISGGIYPLR
jgi:cytochrome b6-f complex iron-sulfur subunit